MLDYGQTPKVTVVLDKATFTRELVEASGRFVLQLPTRAMATLTDVRWHFEDAPDNLRTIHHVAGGQFLATGVPVQG